MSKGIPSERLQLVKWFISHRLHTGTCVNLVLLTYWKLCYNWSFVVFGTDHSIQLVKSEFNQKSATGWKLFDVSAVPVAFSQKES